MTDYISREMTIDAICRLCNANFEEDPCEPSECEMMSLLREIPAADVRPVLRGKWIPVGTDDMDGGMFRCSECGSEHFFPELLLKIPADNFCPNCGADMREES